MKITTFYKEKRFWICLSFILVLILLAVFLFFIGKQHQFIIDNNNFEENGKSYSALSLCEVKIDRRPSVEVPRRTRMEIFATGQSHKITVSYNGKTVTQKFKVPVGMTQVLINVPALVNGEDTSSWLKEFKSITPIVEEETIIEEDEGIIDMGSF